MVALIDSECIIVFTYNVVNCHKHCHSCITMLGISSNVARSFEQQANIFVHNTPKDSQQMTPISKRPNLLGWDRSEIPRILLNLCQSRNQIYLLRLQKFGSMEDLPAKVKNGAYADHRV